MFRWPIFLLIAILCIAWVPGIGQQVVFRKGYVVYSSGDTIAGWVGLKNWYDCSNKVWFSKDSLGRKNILLDVRNCKAFGVPGQEHFVRGVLTEDNYPTTDDCACYYEVGNSRIRAVFFRSVLEGAHFNLYEYIDGVTERYTVGSIQPNGKIKFTNLEQPVPEMAQEGEVYYDYVYRSQLQRIAGTLTGQMCYDIARAGYSRWALMEIVDEMNGQPADYIYRPENHSRGNNFLSLGAAQLTFQLQGNFPPSPGGEKFNISTVPMVKIGRDFNNAWKLPFLTLRTSFLFWSVNYKGYGTGTPGQPNYNLNQFIIQPAVGLLYSYLKRSSLELFVGIDGGVNIPLHTRDELIEGHGVDKVVTSNYTGLRSYYFSSNLMAGAFLCNRKWEIAGFYQLAQCFAYEEEYAFNPRMWGCTVGYHFMKK
jgi:hypothetical protein